MWEIKVFQGEFDFVVRLGNEMFEMSQDANMPNGVNIYLGRVEQIETKDMKEIQLGDCPKGLLLGIIRRLLQTLDIVRS